MNLPPSTLCSYSSNHILLSPNVLRPRVSLRAFPPRERLRANALDFETIKDYQQQWGLSNQQAVISRLIQSHEQKTSVAAELIREKNQVVQLQKTIDQLQEVNSQLQEKLQMEIAATASQQPQQITINTTDLKAFLEQIVEEKLNEALAKPPGGNLGKLPQVQTQSNAEEQSIEPVQTVAPSKPSPTKDIVDWELKSNEELWGTKAQGAANEKIRRSFQAICSYNDAIATGDNDRLAVTNLALRELSGVNGLLVGDWIKTHADEIISHHSKYGMQNSKDPNKVETYYNKRHGQEKIQNLLERINEKLLDGVALKSQQAK